MLATLQSNRAFLFYGGRSPRGECPLPRRSIYRARERRTRVASLASLYFSIHQRKALVRNLSLNGLMLETTLPPPEGQMVVVKLDGLAPIWGRVRWRSGGKAGIRFDQPISAEALFLCALRRPVANDDPLRAEASLS